MIESAMNELICGAQSTWTAVRKLTDEWLASDNVEVPLLLRGVFLSKPSPAEWQAMQEHIDTTRQRRLADRMYQRRKEYMRDYMRKRKQQSAEQ